MTELWYNEIIDKEQAKRIYIGRAFSGNCHHRVTDGNTNASIAAGEKAGPGGCLYVEPETVGLYLVDVCRR